jgi:hypothetical protein
MGCGVTYEERVVEGARKRRAEWICAECANTAKVVPLDDC